MAVLKVKVDYPTIQDAVNAASPGDVILVEGGIYNEQVVVSTNYLQIIGEADAVLDGQFKLGTAFLLNNVTGVRIKSFKITRYLTDAIYINRGSFNVIERNCLSNNDNIGIDLFNTVNIQVVNNVIIGTGYYGIYNYQSRNTLIEDNKVLSSASVAIYVSSTDSNCDIYNNELTNNGYGVYCLGGNSRIVSNKISGSANYGIYVFSNILVKNNKVVKSIFDGIYVSGQNNFVLENFVSCNERNGIAVYGSFNQIVKNVVVKNKATGIYISSTLNTIKRNVAKENRIFDINLLRPNNYVLNNECENSNPAGLCQDCVQLNGMDFEEVL